MTWKMNHRFEKKETLIWTRSWSGLYAFLKYKHYTKNSLKQWPGEKNKNKKIKNNGIYNTYQGPLSQEWIEGRYWSSTLTSNVNQSNEQ